MNQSLKNPQLKKTLIRITLWMLLVTVAGCILFVGLSKLQAAQMMRQNIAMAGRMSTEDDAQNIALFTDPISEQDYEAGKALLSPYGVNVEMDPSLYQPYQSLLMQDVYKRQLVDRREIPAGMKVDYASIEEIIVFLAKGGN